MQHSILPYVNGVLGTTQTTSASLYNFTSPIWIGSPENLYSYYPGYISNMRILKGTALYSGSTFTPPTSPLTAITNTSLLLNCTNASIIDSTAKNNLETVGDAQISTSVRKYGTGSMAFDGTGDYCVVNGQTSDFAFGTGDFTIEMWVYFNALGALAIVYDGRPASTDSTQVCLFKDASNYMTLQVNGGYQIVSGIALAASTWYHIAVSRAGTSTKMFINGTQTGSTYSDSTNYTGGAGRPVIGASGYSLGSLPMNGYIDDLRITKGVARYTSNFTPPAAQLPAR